MSGKITKENAGKFLLAALIRAVKTVAQTGAAMISPAMAGAVIDWKYVASISAIAGLYSLATSLATGLPEMNENILISESGAGSDGS